MKKTLIAHILDQADDNASPYIQTLREHSENVAMHCAAICRPYGLENLGRLTGYLHDMGKSAPDVQDHLWNQTKEKLNHSAAGMRWIWERTEKSDNYVRLTGQIVALAIGCHHSGRCDYLGIDGSRPWLERMFSKQADLFYHESVTRFFSECCEEIEIRRLIQEAAEEIHTIFLKARTIIPKEASENANKNALFFGLGFIQRFIFSALVDADWSDTASFMNHLPLPSFPSDDTRLATWNLLCDRMEQFTDSLKAERPIDILRREISDQCLVAAQGRPAGIYRLYVPTGGGKTFSGLRFCVQMARRQNAHHLFYFAPYKSITKQNAENIRRALGEEYVLEHHSDVLFESDEYSDQERWLALSQRWQGVPVICTTMVQLLNTLFAAPRQNVRRLSALAGSVLLLDEIQALPLSQTCLLNLALDTLVRLFDCTVILCTATQPDLDTAPIPLQFADQKDIVPDYQLRFQQFKRTKVIRPMIKGGQSISAIADFLTSLQKDNRSILVVLNTKNVVNKLFDELKPLVSPECRIFCLTTNLCQQHRNDVLDEVDQRLKSGRSLICISTQLIEAGVDLSFDCVVRDLAGLPSIAQAAGRCNRHGESNCRPVYLIECAGENLDALPEIYDGREITRELLATLPEEADLLSPQVIQLYYQRYYGDPRHQNDMLYPFSVTGHVASTMVDLLSINSQGIKASKERRIPCRAGLCQAFGTAESAFAAIPDETISVLVPYGRGKELLLELQSARANTALLKDLQPYTISISQSQYRRLGNALYFVLDGEALALQENYYDSEHKGLSFESVGSTAFIV